MLLCPKEQFRKYMLPGTTTQALSSKEGFILFPLGLAWLCTITKLDKEPWALSVPENKCIEPDKNFHIIKTSRLTSKSELYVTHESSQTELSTEPFHNQFVLSPANFVNADMVLTENHYFFNVTLPIAIIHLRVQAIFRQLSWRVQWSLT